MTFAIWREPGFFFWQLNFCQKGCSKRWIAETGDRVRVHTSDRRLRTAAGHGLCFKWAFEEGKECLFSRGFWQKTRFGRPPHEACIVWQDRVVDPYGGEHAVHTLI